MLNRHGNEVPIPQRANRCLRSATLKVMLSGAAAAAAQTLADESATVRTGIQGEAAVAAALPKLSIGAELALEHALSAYAQTAFACAKEIKESLKIHNKVSLGCMQAACSIVNAAVFSSTTLQPGAFNFEPASRRKAMKKRGDQEAGGDEEAAASGDA